MPRSLTHPSDCACPMLLRQPKDNGTCAACGGWLPGEREKGPDLANLWGGGTVDKNSDAYQFARCRTCNHKRIDHVIDGGCLTRSCACMFFAEGEKVN